MLFEFGYEEGLLKHDPSEHCRKIVSQLVSSGEAMIAARKEYEAKEGSLTEEYRVLSDDLRREFDKVVGGDKVRLAKLDKMSDGLRNGEMESKVLELFTGIFKNMHSSTVTVLEKNDDVTNGDRHPGVTVGKFGFGIKRNHVSRGVEKFSELRLIIKFKDEIVKGMFRYKNLFAWAEKLERFAKVVGDLKFVDEHLQLEFPLRTKVVFQQYRRMQYSDMLLVNANTSSRRSFLCLQYRDAGDSGDSTLNVSLESSSTESMMCYMQLRDELFARLPEIEERVSSVVELPKRKLAELRDVFAKEVMLLEI
jgi:hypothetical protein